MKSNIFLFFLLICYQLFTLSAKPKYITQSKNYYIVKEGDTIDTIAEKNNLSVQKIVLFNEIEDNKIFVGQKIYLFPKKSGKKEYITKREIPESGIHIVQKGETLFHIAKIYDIYVPDLIDFNNLTDYNVKPGDKIVYKKKLKKTPEIVKSVEQEKKNESEKITKNEKKIETDKNVVKKANRKKDKKSNIKFKYL